MKLKEVIDDFKEILPLVEELSNPALKRRHWEQLFDIIGAEVPLNDNKAGGTSASYLQHAEEVQVLRC